MDYEGRLLEPAFSVDADFDEDVRVASIADQI